jgi:hypothetical protein
VELNIGIVYTDSSVVHPPPRVKETLLHLLKWLRSAFATSLLVGYGRVSRYRLNDSSPLAETSE